MQKKRQRANPFKVIFLLLAIVAFVYIDRMIIPTIPPLFQPTPTATRPAESFVTDAKKLEEEGKYSLAILAYKEAVQADPRNPTNYVALARLNIYTSNYKDAITNAENALLLNSKNDTAMALRGWAMGLAGDYIQAEAALNAAIAINKDNASAYAYLAETYTYLMQANQGDLNTLEKAIADSKTAVALAPGTLDTHRARGFILEYTANFPEAVTEFEAAVAINPNIADLHLALGRVYYAVQDYNDAITEFSRANALNPKDSTPETLISKTYAINGDYQKAIQYSQAALADAPTDPYMYGNLGLVYYRNKQYLDAMEVLRIAVKGGVSTEGAMVNGLALDYGKSGQYYYTYGLALAKVGQCGEALQIAQAVQVGLRNDDIAVYNGQETINICELLAKEGNLDVPTAAPTTEGTPAGTP